jgi:hypothetical protein
MYERGDNAWMWETPAQRTEPRPVTAQEQRVWPSTPVLQALRPHVVLDEAGIRVAQRVERRWAESGRDPRALAGIVAEEVNRG